MEPALNVIIILMITGALYALHAKDLLSAVIACGIVGYGLVICFLLLSAPDLAIVQIVVETITLVIMVAVVLDATREEKYQKPDKKSLVYIGSAVLIVAALYIYTAISAALPAPFGEGSMRMSDFYINGALEKTGSINLVTGVIFDLRAYDTLGEATVLVTAVLGVLTILRIRGKKSPSGGK